MLENENRNFQCRHKGIQQQRVCRISTEECHFSSLLNRLRSLWVPCQNNAHFTNQKRFKNNWGKFVGFPCTIHIGAYILYEFYVKYFKIVMIFHLCQDTLKFLHLVVYMEQGESPNH